MDDNTKLPGGKVVRFPAADRRAAADGTPAAALWDQGPSPEESLRVMRAFVGIKDRRLRADLIATIEDASRVRSSAPMPEKK